MDQVAPLQQVPQRLIQGEPHGRVEALEHGGPHTLHAREIPRRFRIIGYENNLLQGRHAGPACSVEPDRVQNLDVLHAALPTDELGADGCVQQDGRPRLDLGDGNPPKAGQLEEPGGRFIPRAVVKETRQPGFVWVDIVALRKPLRQLRHPAAVGKTRRRNAPGRPHLECGGVHHGSLPSSPR